MRTKSGESGQALVEFALIAPLFFLLLFSIIQLGLLFGAQNGLVDGVRDATRRAATYRINDASFDATTFAAICDAVESDLTTRLQSEVIAFDPTRFARTVSYEWQQNPNDPTKYFLVAHIVAKYKHPLYVPIIGNLLDGMDNDPPGGPNDGSFTLQGGEQMRVENPSLAQPISTTAHPCSS